MDVYHCEKRERKGKLILRGSTSQQFSRALQIISKSVTSSSAARNLFCFRIRKIAHDLTPETVQNIISPSNPNVVRIKSWAPEANSEDSQSWLVATVLINDQEPNFFGLVREKSLRLPRNLNDSESLIVDSNFLGMTTLASPRVTEITVEYATCLFLYFFFFLVITDQSM